MRFLQVPRYLVMAMMAAVTAASIAACWTGARTPGSSGSGSGITCVSYPADIVEQLSWSADGDLLAIRSVAPGSDFERVSLLRWPTMEKTAVAEGDRGQVLEPLAPAEDGRTIYVWFTHSGQLGIWRLQQGSAPQLLGGAYNDRAAGELFWTPEGIIMTTVPATSPGLVTWTLVRWAGQEVVVRPATWENGGEWASGDGHWIVAAEGQAHHTTVVVHHDSAVIRLSPALEADPVGMTPAKDAVVYEAFRGGLNTTSQLLLHILPLSGEPEMTMTVSLATQGLGEYALSSNGILAYTGLSGERDRVCLARLDFGAAK